MLVQGLPTTPVSSCSDALQQYGNGQTVAWIEQPSKGDPDPEHPAPTLTLTARTPTSGAAGASNPGVTAAVAARVGRLHAHGLGQVLAIGWPWWP